MPPGPRHPKPMQREGVSTPRTRAQPSPTPWKPGSTLTPSAHLGGGHRTSVAGEDRPPETLAQNPQGLPEHVPEGQLPGAQEVGRTAACSHA